MLPPFDAETGRLPDGVYEVDWQELVERFGWYTRRRQLLDGLADAVELLAAAGCRRVWINGSFVPAKEEPADFDACWDSDGVDVDGLDPVLLDLSDGRAAQKTDLAVNSSPTSSRRPRGWSSQSSSEASATRDERAS